jgi:inner membrane protein
MTAPTHITFGAFCYFVTAAAMQWPVTTGAVATAAFGSLLPDIDLPTSAVGRPLFPISRALNEQIGHRTLTHSVIGILLLVMILLPLFLLAPLIFWALVIGYFSHLLIDTENKAGIELLYPAKLRAWFFKDERYRITVGSREETILLAVLVVFTLAFFPVTIRGFTGTMHYLLGDTGSAVTDFYRFMPNHQVIATVAAIDTISQEEIRGEFPVLGANGNNAILIKQDGKLREVGPSGHLRPERVRLRQGVPHKLVEQEIEMGGHVFQEIEPFVKDHEVYLFGTLHVVTDKNPLVRVDSFNPIRRSGSTLVLEYATYNDLIVQGFHLTPVEQGTLLLKFALSPEAAVKPVSLTTPQGSVATFNVKVKDLTDLTVSLNTMIKKGDVLVRDRIAERELTAIKAESVDAKEQWKEQQRITAAELADLRGKVATEDGVLHRLQERHAVYSGAADLFTKERKQLSAEIEAQETKLSGLRSDLAQREMKQRVDALQHENKLRDLAGRHAKLEAETVVFSTVTGTVIGMETEHGAESITVKLAVATTKENDSGQGTRGNEDGKIR